MISGNPVPTHSSVSIMKLSLFLLQQVKEWFSHYSEVQKNLLLNDLLVSSLF